MRLLARTTVLSIYIAGLIYATLIASPQPRPEPNTEPLRTISACWAVGGDTMVVNLLGNLALLAPLGIIGPWFWGSAPRWEPAGVLVAGFLASITIETIQHACGHRMADVDDVLLNTIGAGMGLALVRGGDRLRRFWGEWGESGVGQEAVRGGGRLDVSSSVRAIR